MIELVVNNRSSRLRLDRLLADELRQFSRSRIQNLIRTGSITLNGKPTRPGTLVRNGDTIRVCEPPPEKISARPEKIPLTILFEDDDLIVIDKAPGMVVHSGAGNHAGTLVNALLAHCATLSGIGGRERPGIVHRLDKETSGCMVIAKNDVTHQDLARQFAERTVEKTYLALVTGELRKKAGVIDAAIGRHPVNRQRMAIRPGRGRAARTDYRVLGSGGGISLVECALHSGRTHQVRVHLHHLGHPVLGDKVYRARGAGDFPRQMLHAWRLGFRHPRYGDWKKFEAPLPEDFQTAMRGLVGNSTRLW